LATWEKIGPGVLVGDVALGFSYRDAGTSTVEYLGASGTSVGGFGSIGVQAQLVGMFLNDFYSDKRWRLEDYERLSVGLGGKSTGNNIWFGVDYGVGVQGLFRVSNLLDVGGRFYWGFFNDTNMVGVDKGSASGIFFVSGRARLGNLYLDYTRGLRTANRSAVAALNVIEARYVLSQEKGDQGAGIGVRVDFATGKNDQPPPTRVEVTNLAARITYTYASY